MTQRTDVAVIIVNYGTSGLVVEAVQSVLHREHGGRRVIIHVIDNASPGGDVHKLVNSHRKLNWGDSVILHESKENLGFGRANNHVIEYLRDSGNAPEYVFLLNPDAQLINEAIHELASFLDENPNFAVAGSALFNASGNQVSAAYRFPSATSEFVRMVNFGPVARIFEKKFTPSPTSQLQREVDWVSGAAVMFRFESLIKLNGFSPVFFLYYEEVELMHRIHASGFFVAHVPTAMTQHIEGVATKIKSTKRNPTYWYESWRFYFLLTRGKRSAVIAAILCLLGAVIGTAIAAIRLKKAHTPDRFFYDFTRLSLLPLLKN